MIAVRASGFEVAPPSESGSGIIWTIVFVMIVVVFLAMAAVWLWALFDAGGRPSLEWDAAGQSKALWVLVILCLGAFGAILYLTMIRPDLRAPATKA